MSKFPDMLQHLGGVPVGFENLPPASVRMTYANTTAAPYVYWANEGRWDGNKLHSTLLAAYNATTSARHDRILLTNEDHDLGATLTWSNNDTHLIGMSPIPMHPRTDIYQANTTTFDPMMEVSGRGNIFSNLTLKHGSQLSSGTGYATDLTCMRVSGRYNYFDNVYFYTPRYAEQDVATTYMGVDVTGHNNYFKGCKFGSDGLERDQANFNLQVSGVGNIFEDCIFQMGCAGTAPFFVNIYSITRDMKYTIFKNCTFYAHSGNYTYTPADAFHTTADGGNTAGVIIDSMCNFVNVSQISDTTHDSWIWKPVAGADETITVAQIALAGQGA